MNRGLYGQSEGNEKRIDSAVLSDLLMANEIAEGDYLRPMEKLATKGDLKGMAKLRDNMRNAYIIGKVPANLAQDRADTVLRQAMRLLKI
jgi:hypothetical protein